MAAIFDPSKPESRKRFISEEVRGNFQALSRANDLRCTEQDPPDLTVHVEAGAYAITSERTLHFTGGDSDPIDTTTGGSATQQRIVVLELDDSGGLHFNYNGSWVTPPVMPVAPSYNANRIPLCEILVTYGDTSIIQDNVVDVRPMVNLGSTGPLINPGRIYTTALPGQTAFDTSIHFTFNPNNDELLVWSNLVAPFAPPNGLFYRVSGVDYLEIPGNDHTIFFTTPFTGGEQVVIWKAGLAPMPGQFGLADLSNVDGNQEAAFLGADVPTVINPFLTISGHNAINHLALPQFSSVVTHLTTIATPPKRHHASEIEVTPTPGGYSFNTNVQDVLVDVRTNIYTRFLAQHITTGEHGPSVTINTPAGANPSLQIINGLTDGIRVIQTSSGKKGIAVYQQTNDNALRLEKSNTGNANCLHILNSGNSDSVYIEHQATSGHALEVAHLVNATDSAVLITNQAPVNAVEVVQNNAAHGYHVNKTSTGSGNAVDIYNQGSGAGLRVTQSSTVAPSPAVLFVDNSCTTGRAVEVDQRGSGITLYLNKISTDAGNIIEINNAGSGYDVRGHNNNWNIDKNGNVNFNNGNFNNGNFINIPTMVIEQTIAPGAITSVYSDIISATINVQNIGSYVLISFDCSMYIIGNKDIGLDIELRTAAAGGGSQIVTRAPLWLLNVRDYGLDPARLPIRFAFRVLPGAIGSYPVYARLRTNTSYPDIPTISDAVLVLQTLG